MNTRPAPAQGLGLTLGDVYYVLFKHKWKIILCSLAGVAAAILLYYLKPPPYQSEAKLFIRYVLESKSPGTGARGGTESNIRLPDQRGENIINSEMEILTSFDLAQQVVDVVGAEKILGKAGGGGGRNAAASVVMAGLTIEAPRKGSVIRIVFKHPDPTVTQPVLNALIDCYLKKHTDIHQSVGTLDDFLTQQTDQLRTRLAQTEEELRKIIDKAGVVSIEDAKKAYADQSGRIRQELFNDEAELESLRTTVREMTKLTPQGTNSTSELSIPVEKFEAYDNACVRLNLLRDRERNLLTQFTDENVLVKEVRAQIAVAANLKRKLQEEYPKLASLGIVTSSVGDQRADPRFDLASISTRIPALESKIKVLNSQHDRIRTEAANLGTLEASILELQRRKTLQEANYRYFSSSLEQARIDEALGAGRISNISRIQTPSPAARDFTKSLRVLGMVLVGGVLAGLVWAFVLELYLDRSVKRPSEITRRFHLPLFLHIPDISKDEGHLLSQAAGTLDKVTKPPVPASEQSHPLHLFCEALRDRLIMFFESNNLTHKPKLIAVTGMGKGCGVSTMAAGLAACLSETGDGKVLLADMNGTEGSARQFFGGKGGSALDKAVQPTDDTWVQENLYVVAEKANGNGLSRVLPKRFSHLVPKLKASDYDYIIFDMPPISQTSVTPRLAGFMDMVLLVVEAEKSDGELVQQATDLLASSKATVGIVLNKTRNYVPPRLHQEYLSNT